MFPIPQKHDGPKKHRPVAIVLDRSQSTYYLREGMNRIFRHAMQTMKNQTEYRQITELLVIQFDTEPEVMAQFTPLADVDPAVLELRQCAHCTNTGKALLLALELLTQKKQKYRELGEECFQPLLFLVSDGEPDPGENAPPEVVREYAQLYAQAGVRIRQMEENKKLVFAAASLWNQSAEPVTGREAELRKERRVQRVRELTLHSDHVVGMDVSAEDLGGIERFFEIVLQATKARPWGTPLADMLQDLFPDEDL